MITEFFRFELRQQLQSPLLWLLAALFALLGFGAAATDAIQVGGAIGNVYRNAPIVVIQFLTMFTLFGLLICGIFVSSALLRDFDAGSADLLFANPIKKRDFLIGRFSAALLACLAVYVVTAAAIFSAQFMPWIEPVRLGAVRLMPYVFGIGVMVLPNVLFTSALLTLLAVTTRSVLWVYVGVLGFLLMYVIGTALSSSLDNVWIVTLADPFGLRALSRTVRYWSAAERNLLIPALSGYLLANRVLWMLLSLVMAGLAFSLFKTERAGTARRWFSVPRWLSTGRGVKTQHAPQNPVHAAAAGSAAHAFAAPGFGTRVAWRQCAAQLRFDAIGIFKSAPFIVMLLFALINFVPSALLAETMYDAAIYPVSSQMLQALSGAYSWLLFIIAMFYAGELVWKERQAKLSDVVDAMPTPNWTPLVAKLGALLLVVACFQIFGALSGMLIQAMKGYFQFEPLLYLKGITLGALYFVLIAGLALALQVVANNKFIGYAAMIVVLIMQLVAASLGWTHGLYQYGASPDAVYSDMNGYGHFLPAKLYFTAYWALVLSCLLLLAAAFWLRGASTSFAERATLAKARLRGRLGWALGVTALSTFALGGFIFWNTNVLNTFRSPSALLDLQARYERDFKQYASLAQPKIIAIDIDVDLRPETQSMRAVGTYRIRNPHQEALTQVHIQMPDDETLTQLDFGSVSDVGATLSLHDRELGYRIYQLQQPMLPGAERELHFTVELKPTGFGNAMAQTQIVENGSFFNSRVFPAFGYSNQGEIGDRTERRKRGLGEPERMPKLQEHSENGPERASTYLGDDADWLAFKTSICTAPDQIALAPGYLKREFMREGRRCFSYAMDRPMLNFYAYLSARWQVKKALYTSPLTNKTIPLEVYFDAKHPYNVDRMLESMQKSLHYYETNFSPYQHQQARIMEFPGYASFAQAFANTIPYSENIGFIADLRPPEQIDYVFYVTAHEIAHQWWAHQVIGANVQGATMLSESLAQYSALMVMEKQYGRDKMRKFLKYELDRYLSGRGGEILDEQPLYKNENQAYIHYRKGSLVFYRLREDMGEAALNAALAKFIAAKSFQTAPYTTSLELIGFLRAQAKPETQQLITDLFEKISFYDNRVDEARAVRQANGSYLVTINASAAKLYADGTGKETPAPMQDYIDVGVYAGSGKNQRTLYLKREYVTTSSPSFSVLVNERPSEVGFDPDNKLIDRVSVDNRKSVELVQ
jgi:ABC-2 type transport system permease protein